MKSEMQNESLIETRRILELAAVKMAAERRTHEDLHEIKIAQDAFSDQTLQHGNALDEDLIFHLKVVSAGKNNGEKFFHNILVTKVSKIKQISIC